MQGRWQLTREDSIAWGRRVLEEEAQALMSAADRFGDEFGRAVELLGSCTGRVVVTGLGKSGHVGAKVASTFASTGSPSTFLHPSEALHGDFGVLMNGDCVLAITYGGETREVLAVVKYAKSKGLPVIGLTGRLDSSLANLADVALDAGVAHEADGLNLAPTASSTLALAIGDALAVSLMHSKNFTEEHFARLHPGGSLGRRLAAVRDYMHSIETIESIRREDEFHAVIEAVTSNNFGVTAVIDDDTRLLGCVTDGDLRRALLERGASVLETKAQDFMTKAPKIIFADELVMEAISSMESHSITSLFVLDRENGQLQGLIRLHDLLAAKII